MAKLAKKLKKNMSKIDRTKTYGLEEAVTLIKSLERSKFDETLDISVNLNVDPKYADQNVRGMVNLPAGTGKTIKVAVFAKGDKADLALKAGADYVGAEDLADKIMANEISFDRCIATPDMMLLVGKLGKVLGPKGLMPNPKLGTVTPNVDQAVLAAKAGSVEFRAEKAGIVHAGIGKCSFDQKSLVQNAKAFVDAIVKARPTGAKGVYVKKITMSSTMGPSVNLDLANVLAAV